MPAPSLVRASALLAACLLHGACSAEPDDATPGPDAGQGGSSSSAGGAPAAGSGGAAGKGGAAGLSGSSGQAAGSASAGAAGEGGAAGQGGAGAAGQGGSAAGAAGGAAGAVACEPPAKPEGKAWRSALFPAGWKPLHAGGEADAQGRALPDFAYAGYRRGDVAPPVGERPVVATVDAALGDGKTDATAAIQGAIDQACAKGGGAVLVPAGTYRVTLPGDDAPAALTVACSRVTLRGAGPKQSRLLLDDAKRMRGKAMLRLSGPTSPWSEPKTTLAAAEDIAASSWTVRLASTAGLAVGQWVVLRADNTDAFRQEHRMDEATSKLAGLWPAASFKGLIYARTIAAIDGDVVTLDAPTFYPLKKRDKARLYPMPPSIEEVAVEALGLGMVASELPMGDEGKTDDDYETAGTLGHAVHASRLLDLGNVHDAWVDDVETFEAAGNPAGVHILSLGVNLGWGAFRVQVSRVDIGRPQYRGGGGNGYAFQLGGNDDVIERSSTYGARHGFTTNYPISGNVVKHTRLRRGRYSSDTHRFLAHANLFDAIELEETWMQSVNRGVTSGGAGFTGTQTVFWNPRVTKNHALDEGCAVETAQFGHGYAIGSQADAGAQARLCPGSFTNGTWAKLDAGAPADFVEGEGKGATLDPPSLHEGQRHARWQREGGPCPF